MKLSVGNLYRCLDIFEALLSGKSLSQVAVLFDAAPSLCQRLSKDARLVLSHPSSAWPQKLSRHPPSDGLLRGIAADRRNAAFWFQRIAIARSRLRPCERHNATDCRTCRVNPSAFLRLNSPLGSIESKHIENNP
jgi:hypothetical protein